MPKVLSSSHAEDVGGMIVEPGESIPRGADADVVKQLEADGKIVDSKDKEKGGE